MDTEVIYQDGSMSTFAEGAAFHDGPLAIERLRLIAAKHALSTYLRTNGAMQLTANGAQLAIKNVIEPLTGKTYKRSRKGKEEALADCETWIDGIERGAVVLEEEE